MVIGLEGANVCDVACRLTPLLPQPASMLACDLEVLVKNKEGVCDRFGLACMQM